MSRQVVLACWAVVAVAAVACEATALASGGRVRGLLGLMARVTRHDLALVGAFLGWMWVGWHFFAR